MSSSASGPSITAEATGASPAPTCECCGAEARVRVHEGYRGGAPVVRTFCLLCATDIPAQYVARRANRRLGLPTLIGIVGLILVLIGLSADAVIPEPAAGFGLHQQLAVILGCVVAFLGALLRVDLLALTGLFVLIVAVSIDHFALSRNWGIGWHQQTLLVAGAGCLAVAAVGHLRRRWRSQPVASSAGAGATQ